MRESFSAHPDNEERPRLSELIQSIDPVGRKTRIVAIDGHGGSGKSELARQLAGALGESAIVHTDDSGARMFPAGTGSACGSKY